jgi:hypothetical protein
VPGEVHDARVGGVAGEGVEVREPRPEVLAQRGKAADQRCHGVSGPAVGDRDVQQGAERVLQGDLLVLGPTEEVCRVGRQVLQHLLHVEPGLVLGDHAHDPRRQPKPQRLELLRGPVLGVFPRDVTDQFVRYQGRVARQPFQVDRGVAATTTVGQVDVRGIGERAVQRGEYVFHGVNASSTAQG